MKKILLNNIQNNEVFSVLIKWKNTLYYTGYYYDEHGNDYLFNDSKNIVCFKTVDELFDFYKQNNLNYNRDFAEYDFDVMPTNPLDYHSILDKWNILNTISTNLNIAFEGNENIYNDVYNYLFSCNFSVNPLPTLYKIPDNYFRLINSVFNMQNKVLEKLDYFDNSK